MRVRNEQSAAAANRSHGSLLVAALLFAYAVVAVRNAWLCDDAYITYRTVDNFVNGHGLTWNTAERVQAYTHPLWMFIHAAFYVFTREIYYTSLALSLITSLCAVSLGALRLSVSAASAAVGLSILLFSKAFVDYSTSGLENPLTYLILVVFLLFYFRPGSENRQRLALLSLAAALGALNRMDTLLFFLPPLLAILWQQRSRRAVLAVAFGFAPLVVWEAFSLFYYGFPFPNTAYAKLNTGIPESELLAQGITYLKDSLTQDRVTIPVILAALGAAVATRKRELLPLVIGVLLYLLYVVKVGGDFMSGRFLSVPLFCVVAIIWRLPFSPRSAGLAISLVLAAGILSPNPPPLSTKDYGAVDAVEQKKIYADPRFERSDGITDERRYYYPATGLLKAFSARESGSPWPNHVWATAGRNNRENGRAKIHIDASIGFLGFFAGPGLYVIDTPALANPLLARLPTGEGWRIGHFFRAIPNGYVETLLSGSNEICDERLALYYDKLTLVTRGELFSGKRLAEIWKLNTGQYDDLIDRALYRSLPLGHNAKGLAEYSVPELEEFLRADPNDAYAHYKLGVAETKRGKIDQAIVHWEAAVREHPNDRCMRRDLAYAHQLVESQSANPGTQ